MREIIYSRDHRVNRHKFDGVDPVVLYPLNMFVSLYLAAEKKAQGPGGCTHLRIK